MSNDTDKILTAAIPAYGDSPYITRCIRSLLSQTVPAAVVIATSTPTARLRKIAEHYGLPLYINDERKGIASDWNYALSKADTELMMLAHQDDVYHPRYAEKVTEAYRSKKLSGGKPQIIFTDYAELRGGRTVANNRLLMIKRLLTLPLRVSFLQDIKTVKRAAIAFGNGISAPTITYVREEVGDAPFKEGFKSNIDWELTERLSLKPGAFVYIPEVLMAHRIHADSTTNGLIRDTGRGGEDLDMLRRFWPEPCARLIERFYKGAEYENRVRKG